MKRYETPSRSRRPRTRFRIADLHRDVEVGDRLVADHEPRRPGERARDRHPLLHPAGEGPRAELEVARCEADERCEIVQRGVASRCRFSRAGGASAAACGRPSPRG